jgi:hypothetical protein
LFSWSLPTMLLFHTHYRLNGEISHSRSPLVWGLDSSDSPKILLTRSLFKILSQISFTCLIWLMRLWAVSGHLGASIKILTFWFLIIHSNTALMFNLKKIFLIQGLSIQLKLAWNSLCSQGWS